MKRILEISCYNAESAIKADKAGADRIEFCDNFTEGGTTPSIGNISYVLGKVCKPVHILIRPRGGDFCYTEAEFEIMKEDIKAAKNLGADGVVLGILTKEGKIDISRTGRLAELAAPVDICFHRAFDMVEDQYSALEELIRMGFNRILTSGAKNTALFGAERIASLVEIAAGRITIMPGSGIREDNLQSLIKITHATEYHASAKIFTEGEMVFKNSSVSMGKEERIDEYKNLSVDSACIIKMKKILES